MPPAAECTVVMSMQMTADDQTHVGPIENTEATVM